jgi:hypothetical protein
MDDAATAMRRMEIAIKAFLAACDDGQTMRLDELAKLMREAIEWLIYPNTIENWKTSRYG